MYRSLSRRRRIAGLCILAVLGSVALWWWVSRPKKEPTAVQIMAVESSQHVKIVVGSNVHVSKANETVPHRESVVAADPANPSRLFLLAIYSPAESKVEKVVGYLSEDGGKNWHPTFRDSEGVNRTMGDPALAFGPDGSLYFVCVTADEDFLQQQGKTVDFGDESGGGALTFFRSVDGGKTWRSWSTIRQFTDRPWLAVDCSTGRYRGRLYCDGNIHKLILYVSSDQGQSFTLSHTFPIPKGHLLRPGNPVVLSDGTMAVLYEHRSSDDEERPHVKLLLSEDGGQTMREETPVTTYWYDQHIKTTNLTYFPQLAADSAGRVFGDRLYAVWMDGSHPTRTRIMFAFSPDKGRSWIGPTILSEQPAGKETAGDYGAYMPSIAVNKDGVVAVSWYDRRGLPDVTGQLYPPGCNVRLRVSMDGGETWEPSVQLNEQSIKAACEELQDTAGIAADAAGNFHAVWIDDRTGTRQVWTATVKVETK